MRFVKKYGGVVVLILFLNISELAWLPFCDIPWMESGGYMYSLGDILYSFFNQIGYTSLLPAILLYLASDNIHTKGLYLGIIVWNVFEVFQECNLLANTGLQIFNKIDQVGSTILQIIFINFTLGIVAIMYYKCKKWSILSRL